MSKLYSLKVTQPLAGTGRGIATISRVHRDQVPKESSSSRVVVEYPVAVDRDSEVRSSRLGGELRKASSDLNSRSIHQ